MRPDSFDIKELIDHLRGTCLSIDEALSNFDMEEDDLNTEDHDAIDSEIFRCSQCSWWEDVCDQAEGSEDDPMCEDCFADQ